jgi:hypothetical protein
MFRLTSVTIATTFAMILTFVGGFTLAAKAANSESILIVFAGYFLFVASLIATFFIISRLLKFWADNYPPKDLTDPQDRI